MLFLPPASLSLSEKVVFIVIVVAAAAAIKYSSCRETVTIPKKRLKLCINPKYLDTCIIPKIHPVTSPKNILHQSYFRKNDI